MGEQLPPGLGFTWEQRAKQHKAERDAARKGFAIELEARTTAEAELRACREMYTRELAGAQESRSRAEAELAAARERIAELEILHDRVVLDRMVARNQRDDARRQRKALKGAVKRYYGWYYDQKRIAISQLDQRRVAIAARDRLAGELAATENERQRAVDKLLACELELAEMTEWRDSYKTSWEAAVKRFETAELELAEANKELRGWRGCPSCMEDHPEGTICPPHETRVTGIAWRHRQTREWAKRAEEAERQLRNLLAIIHRDGGQHTEAVSRDRSVADAHQVWGELMQRAEDAERQLAECRARNAELALTNEVAVRRADTAEQLTQERARVERLGTALDVCRSYLERQLEPTAVRPLAIVQAALTDV